MARIPDSLRALMANLIDYAGLYPPAGLPLPEVLENYGAYLASEESWMLNRLVLPAAKLAEVRLQDNWRVTLLVEGEPGPLPAQVETLETKLPRRLSLATYCEADVGAIVEGAFAKVRTGGLTPDAIPSSEALADFLIEAAWRRIAFKATAGLHHPLRSVHQFTYQPESPSGIMHGFVNVFLAAAFLRAGMERKLAVQLLEEQSSHAFQFDVDGVGWRQHRLSRNEIAAARRGFALSFGSCSFTEPIDDLRFLHLQ